MVIGGWLEAITRVGFRKFIHEVIEGGGRRLIDDDHQKYCLKVGQRTKSKHCSK